MEQNQNEDRVVEGAWVADYGKAIMPYRILYSNLAAFGFDPLPPASVIALGDRHQFFMRADIKQDKECFSCGDVTRKALLPFDKYDNQCYAVCDFCYGQNIPLEFNMSASAYQEYALASANSNLPPTITPEQYAGLNALIGIAPELGALAESVKKAICHGRKDMQANTFVGVWDLLDSLKFSVDKAFKELDAIKEGRMQPTKTQYTQDDIRMLNSFLGLLGESIEYGNEVVYPVISPETHKLDKKKAVKELGDVFWYAVLAARCLKVAVERVFWLNRLKLWDKFKGQFTTEKSKKAA